MSGNRCRVCKQPTGGPEQFCADCLASRTQAVNRLLGGAFLPGDDATINAFLAADRIGPEGNVRCAECDGWLPVSAFARDRFKAIGLRSACRECDNRARVDRERSARERPAANVIPIPRTNPPQADAARQLRSVLDDLGRTLSRLDSISARFRPEQIGDDIERRTLASQLLRTSTAANELMLRFSGINAPEGDTDNDRSPVLLRR